MKTAYIYADLVYSIFLIVFAAVAPVWITHGYYWWTAFAILGLIVQSHAYTQRINKWEDENGRSEK